MRGAILCGLVVLLVGCNNELTPAGYGVFDGPDRVTSSRAVGSYKSYGGAPLRVWTITMAERDGCSDTSKIVELEINLLANGTGLPVGPILVRQSEAPDVLPSALVRYNGAGIGAATIEIEKVSDTLIEGSFSLLGPETFTGEFGAPICAVE